MIVTPKLALDDAAAALKFYGEALGAEVIQRFELDGKIVYAVAAIGESRIQVKDADTTDTAADGVILDLLCDDPDAVMRRALAAGAEEVFPIADQPYGARQGRFRDPFGVQWIVGSSLTMSDDEVQAALDAMS